MKKVKLSEAQKTLLCRSLSAMSTHGRYDVGITVPKENPNILIYKELSELGIFDMERETINFITYRLTPLGKAIEL